MADGRMLHKKISLNEAVASLENDMHRLLFTWAISHLDIEGRISGSPKVFRAIVVPLLEHISLNDIQSFFDDAINHSLIKRYEVNNEWFIEYPKFKNNQRLNPEREAPSKIPSSQGEITDSRPIGQYGYYGAGWKQRKQEVRLRDKVCCICGKTPEINKRALEVHHLKPFKEFNGDIDSANNISNLVGLCHSCHLKTRTMNEQEVRTQCKLNENSMRLNEDSSLSLSKDKISKEKKRETPLPPDFQISDRVKKWAAGKGLDHLEQHLESFKLRALAKGYKYIDWDAAFENAILQDWAKIGRSPPDTLAEKEEQDRHIQEIKNRRLPTEQEVKAIEAVFKKYKRPKSGEEGKAL